MREKEVLLLLPIGEVRLKVKFESMLSYEGLCLLLLHWHLRITQLNSTESSLLFYFHFVHISSIHFNPRFQLKRLAGWMAAWADQFLWKIKYNQYKET